MPRGGSCDHPNCDYGPCKQLTDEELEPTPEDRALAETLWAEGWHPVSNKYRSILRWKEKPPSPEEVVAKELHNTYWGRKAMGVYKMDVLSEWGVRMAPREMREERTLTMRQYRAFKQFLASPNKKART